MSRCNVGVFDSPYLAAFAAGDAFIESVSESGSKLAGLAAGQTMNPVYNHLVSAEGRSRGLFSETAFVQLDEVVSAARGDASFSDEIEKHLLSRLSGGYRTFPTIDGKATRPDLEATRHQVAILENGGLGVQLLGIAEITSAQRIIMVATGAAKSPAIAAMIEGSQSTGCPASLLRGHPDLALFLDRAAAKDLS